MLIACPSCATSYELQPAVLGPAGRSVRCLRCRNVWFARASDASAEPPAFQQMDDEAAVAAFRSEFGTAAAEQAPPAYDALRTLPDSGSATEEIAQPQLTVAPEPVQSLAEEPARPSAAPDGMDLSFTDGPVPPASAVDHATMPELGEAPSVQPVPADSVENYAARRVRRRNRGIAIKRPDVRKHMLPVAIVMLIGVLTAILTWRDTVVRHAPQMASLYASLGMPVNLRGLAFADVKISHDVHDGVPVLVVEGLIVNPTKATVTVPRLRLSVRNGPGAEIYAWTAPAPQPMLDPGEKLPFRSRLAAPPADSREVLVRFHNRRDAVAGLR